MSNSSTGGGKGRNFATSRLLWDSEKRIIEAFGIFINPKGFKIDSNNPLSWLRNHIVIIPIANFELIVGQVFGTYEMPTKSAVESISERMKKSNWRRRALYVIGTDIVSTPGETTLRYLTMFPRDPSKDYTLFNVLMDSIGLGVIRLCGLIAKIPTYPILLAGAIVTAGVLAAGIILSPLTLVAGVQNFQAIANNLLSKLGTAVKCIVGLIATTVYQLNPFRILDSLIATPFRLGLEYNRLRTAVQKNTNKPASENTSSKSISSEPGRKSMWRSPSISMIFDLFKRKGSRDTSSIDTPLLSNMSDIDPARKKPSTPGSSATTPTSTGDAPTKKNKRKTFFT